jgi:hypothetical protein
MRSLFLGRGPGLKYDYPVKPFDNIEVYGILANLLNVKPNPHNGTFTRGRLLRLSTSAPVLLNGTMNGTIPAEAEQDIPDMTVDEWKGIEEDIAAEEAAVDHKLTWKEYLEIKAEEMRKEMESWWDWVSMKKGDDTGNHS